METDTVWTLVDLALMLLTPVLAWAGLRASQWAGANAANEKSGGMLARLTDSVFVAVKKVNQTAKAKLKAAKDPSSPGGTKITDAEASDLKQAAWGEIKKYWGTKGLATAGKVLGLANVTAYVDGSIEAAIADIKVAEKAGNPK